MAEINFARGPVAIIFQSRFDGCKNAFFDTFVIFMLILIQGKSIHFVTGNIVNLFQIFNSLLPDGLNSSFFEEGFDL